MQPEIPKAGNTKQFIADPIGGWMYVVTTIVNVEQQRLDDFQASLIDKKAQIAALQAEVDQLEPQVVEAIAAMPEPVSFARAVDTASTTPMK